MKKALLLFMTLLIVFIGTWAFKYKTPENRPDSYYNGASDSGVWWLTSVSAEEVDDIWKLDPRIPDNFIPVPGQPGLFMEVDEEGHIVKYYQMEELEDGTLKWTVVNPDIPPNFEPVPGLENVYKVVDADGTVHYYRYIRNADNDTYAFVEVDEFGNDLEFKNPEGSDIPSNYVHISGNIYAVLNEHGVVIGYKERYIDENGNYAWRDVQKPSTSELSLNPTGSVNYEDWLRNGLSLGNGAGGNISLPDLNIPSVIVVEGNGNKQIGDDMKAENTYTETETKYTTEVKDGIVKNYKTTLKKVYDANGNLLTSYTEGPFEIGEEEVVSGPAKKTPDKSKILNSLNEEVARVTTSINYNDSLAKELLNKINASRASAGLAPLTMGGDSQKLAKARAAALAAYDSTSYNNPLYGKLSDMLDKYGLKGLPAENTWRANSARSASDIHEGFMGTSGGKGAILSSAYTQVGIGIVNYNGYNYISEVFFE